MGFINEYATDEDIEKYGLNEIWDRYMARRNMERFYGRRAELTIDRENDVVMMVGGQGPVSEGTQYKFIFLVRTHVAIVRMNLVRGTSVDLAERPFYCVWDLVNIQKDAESTLHEKEIIEHVKNALSTYGYDGVREQIPETLVKFKF